MLNVNSDVTSLARPTVTSRPNTNGPGTRKIKKADYHQNQENQSLKISQNLSVKVPAIKPTRIALPQMNSIPTSQELSSVNHTHNEQPRIAPRIAPKKK
ncbi:MAG TPA: hypothetical protein VN836_02575 [Verrucomicrobiae bacterium]|nr:hypothetical protein [Verrucomicrobiae bacterium]